MKIIININNYIFKDYRDVIELEELAKKTAHYSKRGFSRFDDFLCLSIILMIALTICGIFDKWNF
jgi:hypothetical protein